MDRSTPPTTAGIGTLNEKALHAALKQALAEPGDRFEVPLDGYVIDIVRGTQLIEIQTAGVAPLKRKLRRLAQQHPVRLVVPIAAEKWIVKQPVQGQSTRRKSPGRGTLDDIFRELVRIPDLLLEPNFTVEVLLIREEEVRIRDGTRAWRRRGWVTDERRLLGIDARHLLRGPADVAARLPADLPPLFTTATLAARLGRPRWLAQKMAYCLRALGVIEAVGKDGRAVQYRRCPPPS